MKRFHQPHLRRTDQQWRITVTVNGATLDLCGAVNEAVAWAQCAILNRMHGWP